MYDRLRSGPCEGRWPPPPTHGTHRVALSRSPNDDRSEGQIVRLSAASIRTPPPSIASRNREWLVAAVYFSRSARSHHDSTSANTSLHLLIFLGTRIALLHVSFQSWAETTVVRIGLSTRPSRNPGEPGAAKPGRPERAAARSGLSAQACGARDRNYGDGPL